MGSDTINLRHMTICLTAEQQLAVCRYFSDSGFAVDPRTLANGNWPNSTQPWYCYANMDDLHWGVDSNDLFTVFFAFGFEASTPRNSTTITSVSYTGDYDDAKWLWDHIAQALPALDGYIEWAAEGGTRFRWIFKDGVVTEITPRLVWENDA